MRSAALVLTLVAAALAPGAHAAPADDPAPPIARPNPALLGIRLDYVAPLPTPSGGAATLPPLRAAVTSPSFDDQQFLEYKDVDDLGGFLPAPVGWSAISSGGRLVVGTATARPEIPLYARAAGGRVSSYTLGSAPPAAPSDDGERPVPGLGVPTPVPPPSNDNHVPPPNQGFGGSQGTPSPRGGGTTTTPTTPRPKPPPPTTTTVATVTVPTTPAPTTTAAAPGPTGPPGAAGKGGNAGARCGTAGLTIASDHQGCVIHAVDMAPGDSVSEVMTITNTSGSPYTLSLRAGGTQNPFWHDLRLGVWEANTPAPSPLPPLLAWTTQFNALTTLQPGQQVEYVIELYLPTAVGNEDQGMSAVVDFTWQAAG
jgi:hypothetical protein